MLLYETTLADERTILDDALAKAAEMNLKPLAVSILDDLGALIAFVAQDGTSLMRGAIVPVPGGVLIHDASQSIVGAIGISGDTSDNDELCAPAAMPASGLAGDTG
ncbi:MAG: heme-binding protein [Hyphomicrobiaceae bacterium]